MGTTLRVAPKVHSPCSNRPERNENCVTYVVGLNCYLCCRAFSAMMCHVSIAESAAGDFTFLPGYLHRYNALISTKEKTGWTWV